LADKGISDQERLDRIEWHAEEIIRLRAGLEPKPKK